MSRERPLRGSCSCGRNQYSIIIPENATETARVFFDNSQAHRKLPYLLTPPALHFTIKPRFQSLRTNIQTGRAQATPLTSWLRIPLAWYSSHTISYFPDETHISIRRVYTSPKQPS